MSILDDTKKLLGLSFDYDVFDPDIIMYINAVFSDLNQLGIGPSSGFSISNNTTVWSDYIGTDDNLNSVKTYMGLRVKMLFDPPQTAHHLNATKEMIDKLEWRLNVKREGESWVDPDPPITEI